MKSRLTLLAVCVAGAGQALAQSEESTSGRTLEEVVVTAEHREASLQETEISMSAFTADTLQDLGISNGTDIGQFVPNVTIKDFGGSYVGYGLNIRGVGQNETLVTFDPAAGMYIDGVLIPKSPGALIDVLEMERIGKNLTDESYWNNGANIYNTFGFDINNYGEPRLIGVDFEFAF